MWLRRGRPGSCSGCCWNADRRLRHVLDCSVATVDVGLLLPSAAGLRRARDTRQNVNEPPSACCWTRAGDAARSGRPETSADVAAATGQHPGQARGHSPAGSGDLRYQSVFCQMRTSRLAFWACGWMVATVTSAVRPSSVIKQTLPPAMSGRVVLRCPWVCARRAHFAESGFSGLQSRSPAVPQSGIFILYSKYICAILITDAIPVCYKFWNLSAGPSN